MRPDPLRSLADYELYLYTLSDSYALVESASLVLVRRGATLARVSGEVRFPGSIRLVVRERLVFEGISGQIEGYGYEVWRKGEKLYWYDCQPHPN